MTDQIKVCETCQGMGFPEGEGPDCNCPDCKGSGFTEENNEE